jgi:hypothetical protein
VTPALADGRPVRVVIRGVRITGASSLDARRLADTLVPALMRAFERARSGGAAAPAPGARPAETVAERVVAEVRARIEEGP